MRADGAFPTRLITNGKEPVFSHDGTKIAFSSWPNDEIYVMNAEGSGVTRLTNNTYLDMSPAWSPDDSQIVFVSNRDGQAAIYIMNADGTNAIRVTNDPTLSGPLSWSPDGSRIAGVSLRKAPVQPTPPGDWPIIYIPNIFTMNRDGTNPTVITNEDAGLIYGVSWSPDGAKIVYDWVYVHQISKNTLEYQFRGINIIKPDGSGKVVLPVPGVYPSWLPDSKRILYSTAQIPPYEVYVINADGSGITRLTSNDLAESYPSWSSGTWIAPVVTTTPATAITDRSALLNGTLADMGGASAVQLSFKWDTAPSLAQRSVYETAAVTLTSPGPFSILLTGLRPANDYWFMAKATSNGTSFGQELGFMTSLVATQPATDIKPTSATLNGDLSGRGRLIVSATVAFEYGTTTNYGTDVLLGNKTSTGAFSATVSNLLPGTTYHFRAKGTVRDEDKDYGTMNGSDLTFTTLPNAPLVVHNGATIRSSTEVEFRGALNSLGTASSVAVSFEWGSTIAYGQTTQPITLTSPNAFASIVTGLTPGATYHFRAKAIGNGTAYSSDYAFTMPLN